MSIATEGLARSVHTRLISYAKQINVDPNLVLTRFATERLLYRLSLSRHAENFVLKGAMLLFVWLGEMTRPTRDADLAGFIDLDGENLAKIFTEICLQEVEPDGLAFDPNSISIAAIRQEDAYGGQRVTIISRLGSARIRIQVDIGIGDAIVPEAEWVDFPSLLNLPKPRLRAYRPDTAIAEKLHAMVRLGMRNSRLRDFYDVFFISRHEQFTLSTLADAVRATFERRGTEIPEGQPVALTPAFAQAPDKRTQWQAFIKKSGMKIEPLELEAVIEQLAEFFRPLLRSPSGDTDINLVWKPGGPWQSETHFSNP